MSALQIAASEYKAVSVELERLEGEERDARAFLAAVVARVSDARAQVAGGQHWDSERAAMVTT